MNELPFNACDYRCEHCLVTGDCAVYQQLRKRSLEHTLDSLGEDDVSAVLHDIQESFRETEAAIKQKARDIGIDIDELSRTSSPEAMSRHRRKVDDDPLYRRALDFTRQAQKFLQTAGSVAGVKEQSYLDDIAWHHTVVAVKVYRALGWGGGTGGAVDSANSAAVAVKSLTICIMAFDYLASRSLVLSPVCRNLSDDARKIKEEIKTRIKPARAA